MEFNVANIVKLHQAGFSEQDIEEIMAPKDTNGNQHTPPDGEQDPPEGEQDPPAQQSNPQSNPQIVDIEAINKQINKVVQDSFEELKKALMKNQINSSRLPEQQNEDILATIISPPMVDKRK